MAADAGMAEGWRLNGDKVGNRMSEEPKGGRPRRLVADWHHLMRTFIRPEDEAYRAVLTKYMEQILFGLHEFLASHVGVTR
jgi:hypothetical protein